MGYTDTTGSLKRVASVGDTGVTTTDPLLMRGLCCKYGYHWLFTSLGGREYDGEKGEMKLLGSATNRSQ